MVRSRRKVVGAGLAIAAAWLVGVFFSLFVAVVNAAFAARLFYLSRGENDAQRHLLGNGSA